VSYTTRTTCRACGGSLETIIDLGTQKLTGWLDAPDDPWPEGPLELVHCTDINCELVQLRHTLEPDIMFKDQNYGYLSGINESMKIALEDVVWDTYDRAGELKSDDVWVDIGANDGTLLNAVWNIGLDSIRVGYEPVKQLQKAGEEESNAQHWIVDYFNAQSYPDLPKARVITACAMFYDLEDPVAFCRDIAEVLAPDGVFTIQLSYLPFMLSLVDYPGICHEHLEYYSLKALEGVLTKAGLQVFDLEVNEINGGSLRVYVDHGERAPSFMVHTLRTWEHAILHPARRPYNFFRLDAQERIQQLRTTVHELTKQDKTVAAFTASTKGNVILQACEFSPEELPFAVERNPAKHGKFCAGSGIPIISEEEARKRNPDYFLVFPWYFMDSFRKREKEWHDKGGRWIVPLPNVRLE